MEKTKKPSFFKVLINQDFSTRLQIPPTFVKKYGEYLSSKIVLKNCSNEYWEVEVSKIETSSYFGNGWKRFVEDNGLEFGDFVLFKYCYNSAFKFKIFGTTCCEKEIGRTCEAVHVAKENQKQMKDADQNFRRSVIVIDDSGDDQSGQLKRSLRKRRRKEGDMQSDNGINFNSANPFFHVTLTSTYVSSYLPMPLTFFKKHLKMESQEIKLKINEKIWNVNLNMNYRRSNRCQEARFTVGWMRFVRENNLKERDVCIFEMLKTDASFVFRVRIVRKNLVRN